MTVFCGDCGTKNPDTNKFCITCGKPLRKTPAAAQPAPPPAIEIPQQSEDYLSPPFPTGGIVPNNPVKVINSSPTVAPSTTTLPATRPEKSPRNWFAIVSFILALLSWVIYPIIIGFFAMGLGIFSLYTAKKKKSKIPVIAVIAVIIGLLAIVLNFFYLDLFAPAILPPHS
jgi:hypothetical protein